MMKKFLALLLGCLMICSLFVACAPTNPPADDDNDDDDNPPVEEKFVPKAVADRDLFDEETVFWFDTNCFNAEYAPLTASTKMTFKTNGTVDSFISAYGMVEGEITLVETTAVRDYEIDGTKLIMWYVEDGKEADDYTVDTYNIITLDNGRLKISVTFFGVLTLNYFEEADGLFNRDITLALDVTDEGGFVGEGLSAALAPLLTGTNIGDIFESGRIMIGADGTLTTIQTYKESTFLTLMGEGLGVDEDNTTTLTRPYKIVGTTVIAYMVDDNGDPVLTDGELTPHTVFQLTTNPITGKVTLTTSFAYLEIYKEA